MTQDGDHFSYEDQGSLALDFWLMVMEVILGSLVIVSYLKSIEKHDRYLTPHPIMCASLATQIWSLGLEMIHLWAFSYNGNGVIVFDIISKVIQAFSEVIMSGLLLLLANGWTTTYMKLSLEDDSNDALLPFGAICLMVHVSMGCLTFVDVDASHKYHDFAGAQGFFLIFAKLTLFAIFIYYWVKTNA